MSKPQAIVVHEEACPQESWDDAVRGKVRWRTLRSKLTFGVAELGPGQPHPFLPHRHEPTEVYFISAGEGIVSLDGVEHAVRAGSSEFIPGGVWHGARDTGSGVLRLLYVFAADSFSDVQYVFPDAAAAPLGAK